jgi:sigma-B regulation protein RsbU (phosphoserine phosphatase)
MPTILIVDDEPAVRYGIRRALEPKYTVAEAESAVAARGVMQRVSPDLILLDLAMPCEDGLSFLRWLGAQETAPAVIVVSALDRAQTAVEALKLGAADYLVKGFDIEELRRRVGNQIRLMELDEENARLTARVVREEARRESELRAARCLQAALLPHSVPQDCGLDVAARYVAARELGGDLYDFLRYSSDEWAFALGDVTGKGAAAALYGAVVTGILRSLAPLRLGPQELLLRMNQLICAQNVENRFVTLCFATWHRRHRRWCLASAGQNRPILCRNAHCTEIPLEGFPIGAFEDSSYEESRVDLEAGNIFVFYSDGITESRNSDGEEFGLERLRTLIEANATRSAAELADGVFRELERFAPGMAARDDRTLVVAKVL